MGMLNIAVSVIPYPLQLYLLRADRTIGIGLVESD